MSLGKDQQRTILRKKTGAKKTYPVKAYSRATRKFCYHVDRKERRQRPLVLKNGDLTFIWTCGGKRFSLRKASMAKSSHTGEKGKRGMETMNQKGGEVGYQAQNKVCNRHKTVLGNFGANGAGTRRSTMERYSCRREEGNFLRGGGTRSCRSHLRGKKKWGRLSRGIALVEKGQSGMMETKNPTLTGVEKLKGRLA